MSCGAVQARQNRTLRATVTATSTAAALTMLPADALAHGGEAHGPDGIWHAWTLSPEIVAPLIVASAAYIAGARRLRRRARHGRALPNTAVLAFAAGILVLVIALVSPLDTLGGDLFSAHMLQHVLLMLVAAPLLVLGRPLVAISWAFPVGTLQRAGAWLRTPAVRKAWQTITNPYVAWLLHAVAIWMWHAPPLYEATLSSDLVHALQHTSFLGTALLFWWGAVELAKRRRRAGVGVLYVFTTALHGSILGALLTFSTVTWYPVYASRAPVWGLTVLEDQQLGGLVMWIPAGVIYLIAALTLLATWIVSSSQTMSQGSSTAPASAPPPPPPPPPPASASRPPVTGQR